MAYRPTTGGTGSSPAGSTPKPSRPAAPPEAAEERPADEEQRVAITLSVGEGFKFGCGVILAGVAFYFALIIVVAAAYLVATILNLPLPFGGR
jgi:hypothetical protein